MMRWRLGERRSNPYGCCFCCHVRLGTVLIGIFSLMIDLLVISYALMLLFHPEYTLVPPRYSSMYKPSKHQSDVVSVSSTAETDHAATATVPDMNLTTTAASSSNTTSPLRSICWANCDDHFISLILTFVSAALAVCLLYGTIRGYPKYLLPFFCLQVFDFCITALSIIGYFSYEPSIKVWLLEQTWVPMRRELMRLDTGWLLLVAALVSVMILWLQAYFISVVWSCYKFLCQTQLSQSGRCSNVTDFEMDFIHFDRALMTSSSTPQAPLNSANMNPGIELMVMPPKYEDVLQMTEECEMSSAGVLVSPPPYRVNDKSSDDN